MYNRCMADKDNDVKKLRKALMLDQQEFADLMAVHRETVSKWERGVQKPKAVHLRRMERQRKNKGG